MRIFLISLTWIIADQLSKLWAKGALEHESMTVVPGFLNFTLSFNDGALFGMLGDWPDPWRFILLSLIPALAIPAIAYLLWSTPPGDRFARLGLALILGGAIGNVADRLARGSVIDFIDVYWTAEPMYGWLVDVFGTNRWPTFNIADVGLSCGATLLLIELLRRKPAARSDETPTVGDDVPVSD